jgi:hypothetical protein
MISLVGFLKRPAGVSRDEFQKWWVEKHVPYVTKLPGLRRYVEEALTKAFASRQGVEDLGHFATLGITVFNGLNEPRVVVPGPWRWPKQAASPVVSNQG